MNHEEPPIIHDEPPVSHDEPPVAASGSPKDAAGPKSDDADDDKDKLDELMGKLPFVSETLEEIDTRQLFVRGIVTMIRLVANLALALGAVVLLAAVVKAFGGERAEGGTKILGGLVVLLGFIPLVLSVMIVNRRSKQIQIADGATTIEAVIATTGTLLRMSIEVGAVLVAFNLLVTGFVQFVMGESDAVQYAMYSVVNAQSSFMSGGGGDSSIAPRLFGLVMMVASLVAGFAVLFAGYFGFDLLKIVYNWFLMAIDFVRRILTNTFHRAKGGNASG
ncbi:MAG: hypothetical protein VYB65_01360 [Myxococcota bacterium]|nr:hypothetical protein [Myxococcota bacterium]